MLSKSKYFEAFEKRGDIFNSFISEFAKYVTKTVVMRQNIPWQDIPDYKILVKHFLIEFKRNDITTLPMSLVDASAAMLSNENLLTVLIALIFSKTSIYDSFNVFAAMELVNTWLQAIQTHRKQIPSTFDDAFFLKGLFMILDGEHAVNIAKVLWVVYNSYNILHGNTPALGISTNPYFSESL